MHPIIAALIIAVCFYLMSKIVDEYFLSSLDNIAEWLKMPPSVAGATLLAIGTSAPELGTAMFALFLPDANPALGIGTVVGSAIFQLLVVVGFTAMIAKSRTLNARAVIRDSLVYLLAVLLLYVIVADGLITFEETVVLFVSYTLYLGILFFTQGLIGEQAHRKEDIIHVLEEEIEQIQEGKKPRRRLEWVAELLLVPVSWTFSFIPNVEHKPKFTIPVFFLSLGLIGFFSYLVVISAESLATSLGVPSTLIGLTILAGGTSLPELVSSAILARDGRGNMAIANAIGSNTFDIMISLGFPLLIFTFLTSTSAPVVESNITNSILVLIAVTLIVMGVFAVERFKITKRLGIILLSLYGIYAFLVALQII